MYAFLTVLGVLLAQGAALPKGPLVDANADKQPAPPAVKDGKRRNCLQDFMEAPGGNGLFSKDGSAFYLLASGGPAFKLATLGGESLKRKYTLYRVDLQKKAAEPLVALDQKGDASLVLYGDPLEGLSVVSFIGKSQGCYEGAGATVSISLVKKGAKAVQGTGAFVLARAPAGLALVDAKRMQVLEMDTQSFQTKMVRRVKDHERPLWYEPGNRRLMVFYDDGKTRGLIDYPSDDEKRARRLALAPGDKLLQDGPWFAPAHLNTKKNKIEITELPEWTGPEKPGTYKILLPLINPVATAGVGINFKKRRAVAYGGGFLAKQQWQRLFLYDYTREDPLAVLSVTGKQYVNLAMIDPTGAYAMIEVRDMTTRATVGLKIFDFETKQFAAVTLPAPQKDSGKEGRR